MTIDYDPISSLEAVGYLEREASFLYLVAVHSGYFLRRQYARFAGRRRRHADRAVPEKSRPPPPYSA